MPSSVPRISPALPTAIHCPSPYATPFRDEVPMLPARCVQVIVSALERMSPPWPTATHVPPRSVATLCRWFVVPLNCSDHVTASGLVRMRPVPPTTTHVVVSPATWVRNPAMPLLRSVHASPPVGLVKILALE